MKFLKKSRINVGSIDYKSGLKTLLPYIIGVMSGVTTYFLYSYFNRDIVKIQSVLVRQKDLVLTIDRPLANKLSRLLNGGLFERMGNSKVDLTTIDKAYIIEALKYLSGKSATVGDGIAEVNKTKNALNEFKHDSLTASEVSSLAYVNSSFDDEEEYDYSPSSKLKPNKKPKQFFIESVNKRLEEMTKVRNEIDETIKNIALKTKKALDVNKDKFQIEIIAFNEGNQQTVIRHKGSLVIGQTQLNLKKASSQKIEDYITKLSKAIAGKYNQDGSSGNYLIVEPKAFIVMNLEIDNFNNKNRDIEVVKREYLSGQSNVELTLYDIKNNPIKPFNFLLQNDIEFDPNDELQKYISPFIDDK